MSSSRCDSGTGQRILRGHIWVLAAMVPLLVRLLPLRWLLKGLTPLRPWRLYGGISPQAVTAMINSRLAKPRMMRRRACLRRGLLLFHFLRLCGQPARLNIAAHAPPTDGSRMHAHCWVTLNGQPVADAPQGPMAVVLIHGE